MGREGVQGRKHGLGVGASWIDVGWRDVEEGLEKAKVWRWRRGWSRLEEGPIGHERQDDQGGHERTVEYRR